MRGGAPFVKNQFLAAHIADRIGHEVCAFETVFQYCSGDGLAAEGLGVEEVNAAAFGCKSHVSVVTVMRDV